MSNLETRLMLLLQADIPVILWGPPGIGKTATVNALGKRSGRHVVTLISSLHEPVDFSGWPVVSNGSVKMAPPPWLEELRAHRDTILFLDELTNSPPSVQAALLRVILERVVGDERLPEGCRVVAAANPLDTATDGYVLRPPLANRLAHLEFQLDPLKWAEEFPGYWGSPPKLDVDESSWLQARSMVAAFVRRRPDLLLNLPKDEDAAGRAWPSPRSWDAASRLMALCAQGEWSDCAAMTVGEAAALEFAGFIRTMDLPDPEEVLANPQAVHIPAESDRQFAITSAVCAAVQHHLTEDRWLRLGEFLKRLAQTGADDIASLGMTHLVRMMRELSRTNPRVTVPKDLLDLVKDLHIRSGLLKPLVPGG